MKKILHRIHIALKQQRIVQNAVDIYSRLLKTNGLLQNPARIPTKILRSR